MSSTVTIRSERSDVGRTGRLGSGHRRPAPYTACDPSPTAGVWRIPGAAGTVWTQVEQPPEPAARDSRSEREQQQLRNAAARRQLEARREQELLRRQLREPWDEIGGA